MHGFFKQDTAYVQEKRWTKKQSYGASAKKKKDGWMPNPVKKIQQSLFGQTFFDQGCSYRCSLIQNDFQPIVTENLKAKKILSIVKKIAILNWFRNVSCDFDYLNGMS